MTQADALSADLRSPADPGVPGVQDLAVQDLAVQDLAVQDLAVQDLAVQDLAVELPEVQDCAVERIVLGGVAVDLCDEQALNDLVARALGRGRPGGPPLLVGSVNLDHLHHFGRRAPHAQRAIGHGDGWLMTVDGMPIVWAARRVTGRTHPRLAGSDILPDLLTVAERQGARVGFLGGTDEARDALAAALATSHPGLAVAGHWTPERAIVLDPAASAQLAEEIRAAGVDLLVIGLGKPRQELWAAQHAQRTGAAVVLAFGASADFLAGRVQRAPEWVRERGLEWFYRLVQEPRRLARRYLVQGPPALWDVVVGGSVPPRAWVPGGASAVTTTGGDIATPDTRDVALRRTVVLPDTDHAAALAAGALPAHDEVVLTVDDVAIAVPDPVGPGEHR